MADLPGKRAQDRLESIKSNIKTSYDYFQPNYKRFNEFRSFVFESSLTSDDVTLLQAEGFPQLEFNILEAYISRLLGEFSKSEPAIEVSAQSPDALSAATIQMVEEHMRFALGDDDNEHMRYAVYKDLLSGGFSAIKIFTDYESPMSLQQNIYMERVFDPTLCGFDPKARMAHKGDGHYCFELFPMTKQEFERDHPKVDISKISFRKDFEGFNWSYMNNNKETLIVADYYCKKPRKMKIVQVRDGRVMPKGDYDKMVANWTDMASVPPAIIGERTTTIEHIARYRLIENMVIEYEETDFTMLPIVFIDGDSILIRGENNGDVRQMTRPYVYHAKDAQRLKNRAGIGLANAIENEVQHKFAVAEEALPNQTEFLDAWINPTKQSTLVHKAFLDNDPDRPIPNPYSPIPKIPCPPEIAQTFQGTDSLIQQILGSYDASLGINNNQLSGVAVVEAATQSNSAAMPYVVGFMHGLQRAAQIYVELIPKYWVTPRTIPMKSDEGKRYYLPINQNNDPTFKYETNALKVSVKAGASFQVQKSRTLMMVKEMMGMSQLFAQFISEKGLNFVLDNMEGKGVEQLKNMVDSWLQEMQQQKQVAMQAQQQEMQNNPAVMKNQIEQQKLQLEREKVMLEHKIDMLKLEAEHNKIDADIYMRNQRDKMDIARASLDHHEKLTKDIRSEAGVTRKKEIQEAAQDTM